MTASLIVTVDVEEEGLWDGSFRTTGNSVENVRGLGRFQDLCDSHGICPTYLVDAPVVQDDRSVELLRLIHDKGRCEIGAHLHPWCTPPLDAPADSRTSFMCNLPERAQRAKLRWLTAEIERRFSRRPTSFRAGRYGLDACGARLLADLGYQVDSSVIPFSDYSAEGGPDFSAAPYVPYFVDTDDLCRPSEQGALLEVPVSVGFHHPDFARAHALHTTASRSWMRHFRAVGIFDRLGLARRIKFSPEQSDAPRLRQLADAYVACQAPALVLMLHSSSLLAGYSPYARSRTELDELYRRLEQTFDYCLNAHQLHAATLTEFAASFATHNPPTIHAV
jgi:hypothetical protein